MTTRRFAFIIALCCYVFPPWAGRAGAQETLRYTIISNGKTQGSEVETYSSDGRIDTTFEFNDRGRGPKISAHYVINANGVPLRTDITGNDYLKAPVDEQFAVENGRA